MTAKAKPRRVQPVRTMTDLDRFRGDRGEMPTVSEELPLSDEQTKGGLRSGGVSYKGPELVRMYKPSPYGHIPVDIPDGMVETCWKAGYLDKCPDCGSTVCGDGPGEQCPEREPRKLRRCPVLSCQKPIVDEPMLGETDPALADDPNLISDDAFKNSTPETRTRAMLDNHMMSYHPQESLSLAPHLAPMIMARMAELRRG